jgi:D-3-phosphoglycerate dehydrogenase
VAEHTVAFLLACAINLVYMDRQAKTGNWNERNRVKNTEVEGKVLGLIGLGRIGRGVAKKASFGLGMKVIGYDAYTDKGSLPDYIETVDDWKEVYARADFVSLHVPATPETKNSVNKDCFALMKQSAYLINCARGEVVNEADLNDALDQKRIAGAALDVLCSEPPDQNNPLLMQERLILSPHNGALTYEALDFMGLHAAIGIDEVLSGKTPSWPVNQIK